MPSKTADREPTEPTPVPDRAPSAASQRASGTREPEAMRSISRRVRTITQENERLFRELLAGERRFRKLAKAVWRVQEEERRRLARELHDGIGQTLTALKNQLEWARQHAAAAPGTASDFEESVELASRALNETRELSRLLRPPVLDDLGLEPALAWLARTLGKRTGLEVEFAFEGLGGRLEPELETLVFRVVQEALNNVVKHAEASQARVELAVRGPLLTLVVADRGRGFDRDEVLGPADDTTGVGLRGIRDRAELYGGRFAVRSRPGEGTEIRVTVPLDPTEEA